MPNQMTLPDLDDFTGLSARQHLAMLIELVKQCASMEPDRYQAELNRLERLRLAGKMMEVARV